MITIDQARNNIDTVLQEIRNPPLNRAEHDILRQSLDTLYVAAKDDEESRQLVTDPEIINIESEPTPGSEEV